MHILYRLILYVLTYSTTLCKIFMIINLLLIVIIKQQFTLSII